MPRKFSIAELDELRKQAIDKTIEDLPNLVGSWTGRIPVEYLEQAYQFLSDDVNKLGKILEKARKEQKTEEKAQMIRELSAQIEIRAYGLMCLAQIEANYHNNKRAGSRTKRLAKHQRCLRVVNSAKVFADPFLVADKEYYDLAMKHAIGWYNLKRKESNIKGKKIKAISLETCGLQTIKEMWEQIDVLGLDIRDKTPTDIDNLKIITMGIIALARTEKVKLTQKAEKSSRSSRTSIIKLAQKQKELDLLLNL